MTSICSVSVQCRTFKMMDRKPNQMNTEVKLLCPKLKSNPYGSIAKITFSLCQLKQHTDFIWFDNIKNASSLFIIVPPSNLKFVKHSTVHMFSTGEKKWSDYSKFDYFNKYSSAKSNLWYNNDENSRSKWVIKC